MPHLAGQGRVVAVGPGGNGRADRPADGDAYAERELAADALAVLDATATETAYVVGWSMGAQRGLILAAEHPERVDGLVFIGPAVPLGTATARARAREAFNEPRETYEGWTKFNRNYWLESY